MINPVDSNITMPSTSEETTILGEGKREIPADIRKAAQAVAEEAQHDSWVVDSIAEAILAERKRWEGKVHELQDMLMDMILHRTPEQMREDAAREGIDMDRQAELCRQIFERAKLNALPIQGEV